MWSPGLVARPSATQCDDDTFALTVRLDVLVTCHPHDPELKYFPQVRGHYLARHLAASGLRAEFRQLPLPGLECDVLICSEYQSTVEWFERHLAGPLSKIRARRMYCLTDLPLGGRPHFSSVYCEWFARRGGLLYHVLDGPSADHEHFIGVGVDHGVIPRPDASADAVVFDFPRSRRKDAAANFDPAVLAAIRARVPGCRLVGTGPADAVVRPLFDQWVEYGQPHQRYVSSAFSRAFAFVPGWCESMGLSLAEAQVAGACVVSSEGQVKPSMLCAGAGVPYRHGEPASIAEAIVEAGRRSRGAIAAEARSHFDLARVVARTRAAVLL